MTVFVFDLMLNLVYPLLFGAAAGLFNAVYKYKGDLDMPKYLKLQTKSVLRLGFLKEVLLGAGAGAIAANVFYAMSSMPPELVAALVAAFAGLAGSKYLFKRKGDDTRTLDGEVSDLLNFLNKKQGNKDDKENGENGE